MLTEAQIQELKLLVDSLESQGKTTEEIQKEVDAKKAEMLGQNTLDNAKKEDPAVKEAALAAGENNMDLQQEDGSLALQDPKEEFNKYTEEDLSTIKRAFDQGEFKSDQKQAYEKYKETEGQLDVNLLPEKYVRPINPKTGKPFTFKERISDIAYTFTGEDGLGGIPGPYWMDLANSIGISALTILENTKESQPVFGTYAGMPKGIFEIKEKYENKKLQELIAQSEEIKKLFPPTPSISEGIKGGDLGETIAGVLNGTANVGASVVPAILTKGATLVPQIAAPMIRDYNIEKAKTLYGEDIPIQKAYQKLIDNNELEVTVPAALSTLSIGLERFGIKGIKEAINANKFLSKGLVKHFLTSPTREGFTEVGQLGVETYSESLAKGENALNAAKNAFNVMIENGPETFLQAAAGTIVFGLGGRGAKKSYTALKGLRAAVDPENKTEKLTDKLLELNEQLNNSSDPEVSLAIKKEIDNTQNELKNITVRANGIFNILSEKNIDEISNLEDLKDLQIKRVNELNAKKDKLSQEEYITTLESYKKSFIEAKNKIQGVAEDAVLEAQEVEGISEVSIKNANEINKAYAANPGSTEVFNNTVIPKMQPLLNKVANKLFKEYKEFGEKAETKQDFITDLTYGTDKNPASSLRGLYKSFNPEEGQLLSTYIVRNLENRAKRILDEKVGQQVTEGAASIDAPQAQQLTADERAEFALAEDKIDISKNIGLKLDDNKIKNIVTKHYNPDAKKFKSQISNDFKIAFKKPVDDFFGKDKVSDKQFSNKVTQNAAPLYDMLTVEGMRMARGVDGVNPFVEAGMLVDKDGKLEKAAFENIKVNALLDYLTDPNVPKNTRSNRRIRFKEAVAVSIASSQAIKLLRTDNNLQTKYKDLNQLKSEIANNIVDTNELTEEQKEIYVKIASPKINSGNIHKLLNIGQITIDSKTDIKNKQAEMLDFIKNNKIPSWLLEASQLQNFGAKSLKRSTKQSPKYYVLLNGESVKGEFVSIDRNGVHQYRPPTKFIDEIRPSRGGLYNGKRGKAWQDALAAAKENDKFYTTPSLKRVKIPKKIEGNEKATKKFLKENQSEFIKNQKASDLIVKILNDAVNKNGSPIELASLFITGSLQATSGWVKTSAPITHIVDKFEHGTVFPYNKGIKTVEEHTPPANVAGLSLIPMIKFNQIDNLKPKWNKNFFQVLQSKKNDQSIAKNNLTKSLPEGVSMIDDNAGIKRMAAANLDLNKISNVTTNKTVAEEMKVESPSTPDAIKVANEVVTEDKVEFIIDRAIAKLTELTGTKGFAVDPFLLLAAKDVSLNVLVGGLRTVKATYKAGKNLAKAIEAGYQNVKKYMSEAEWLEFARTATQEVQDVQTPGQVRLAIFNESGVAQTQEQVRKESENLLKDLGVETEGLTTDEINQKLNTLRKARNVGLDKKAPKKKARVFDFDDTLAQSKSKVLYTLPNGTEGSLSAAEFAAQSGELTELGANFDFSQFDTVVKGKKGPLSVLAKKLTEAKGDRDIFVLTARPESAAPAIQSFLRSALGISIPLENITGLGDGKPSAKAFWMAEKVSEGYNDIFFADDAAKNVKAVNKMLTDLGVKKKVQVAKQPDTPSLEDNMDSILRSKKPTKGSIFRRFNIYVPPGADDFAGLLYTFLGKGKVGETQMKFFQDNIMTPFAKGIAAYESAKVSLAQDFKGLKKRYKNKKLLKQKILDGLYTNEQAVRAYLYNKAGYDLSMNKADTDGLIAAVESNPSLKAFADDLSKITKIPEGYPAITVDWLGGNIETDLATASNKDQRREFLTEFINNKEQVFSDQNMQLIKQMHGNDFTDALKNVLERMETGVNRKKGKDKEFNAAMNWLNQSVANVMAINLRSAVLQQLSIINFMNWTHNNPYRMARAMVNVPQFASDFVELWNSSFLNERRGGLKIEINTADLADSEPGNFFLRTQKKLLELGFKPTQWGDSFAISFGGASWYRNRINQLIKEGTNETEAKEQAMLEFQEIAETSQQSSRPDKISRQQASEIGRFILAFANTPLQYARETKKATLDLINGRGDWKTNASKIVYYGGLQNIIFTGLQSALFSLLLSDDDDDEKEEKQIGYAANSMLDGFLRGMGYSGAAISALKNLGMEYYRQREKRKKGERLYDPALRLIQAGATISPPISKKIGDIVEAQKFENWRQYKNDPFYQGFAVANYVSGLANIPADRAFKKAENLRAIDFDKNEAWQNIFLGLGWSPYQLGVEQEFKKKNKSSFKTKKLGKEEFKSTPLNKIENLPEGVLGKAHKDGTIQIRKGLSPAKKKQVLAHEKVHQKDFKSGRLNYDASNVYWDGKAYQRTADKKIIYKGQALPEGHTKLPWEKHANGINV